MAVSRDNLSGRKTDSFTGKNYNLQDFFLGLGISTIISWLFFRTLLILPLFFLGYPAFRRVRHATRMQNARTDHLRQCRDGFQALAVSMSAGYVIENAVTRAKRELYRLWGEQAFISSLWREMDVQIQELHLPMEDAFERFAQQCGLREAKQLAGLLRIAKRSGGNLGELFRLTAQQISDTLSLEQEIQTGITQVKYEQRLMLLMPPGILFYLQLSSYEMVRPLYTTLAGRITMLLCFGLYVGAYLLGRHFSDITV